MTMAGGAGSPSFQPCGSHSAGLPLMPGRAIQRFGPSGGWVGLDGERFEIRAQVHTVGGYSAHADQAGLVEFVAGMRAWPGQVRLVHGELGAKQALRTALMARAQREGVVVDVAPGVGAAAV